MRRSSFPKACRIGFPGLLLTTGLLLSVNVRAADDVAVATLGNSYKTEILPLITRYCQECHSGKRMEADVDLTTFNTLAEIRKHPKVWQKAGEMLDSAQMPPKDAKQPTDDERKKLQQWVRGYLTFEANAQSGDPGRVVLRRLSNSEYTYTLRDLTGISTLAPAKEFPVDGAAGEGFTNTGNALVMSPALITKYLDAAKQVAGGVHEGTRTALDNSMLMLCSSMMSGSHDASQLPVVMVGRSGRRIRTGKILDYKDNPNRQMCRLYLSLMDKMNVHQDKFGDAIEPLNEV